MRPSRLQRRRASRGSYAVRVRIVGGSGPTRGLTRLARAGVLGATSMGLAAGAHLLGGGRLPPAGVLAMVAFLLGLSSVVLTVRRCRFGVLLPVLTVQQALLHLLFDTASRVGSGCGAAMSGTGHTMAAHASAGSALGSCSGASTMAAMVMPRWAMWAAHLAAVALTAGLLARGEAWLWRVADAVVRASALRPSPCPPAAPVLVTAGTPRSWRPLPIVSGANPRAPPAGRRPALVGPA